MEIKFLSDLVKDKNLVRLNDVSDKVDVRKVLYMHEKGFICWDEEEAKILNGKLSNKQKKIFQEGYVPVNEYPFSFSEFLNSLENIELFNIRGYEIFEVYNYYFDIKIKDFVYHVHYIVNEYINSSINDQISYVDHNYFEIIKFNSTGDKIHFDVDFNSDENERIKTILEKKFREKYYSLLQKYGKKLKDEEVIKHHDTGHESFFYVYNSKTHEDGPIIEICFKYDSNHNVINLNKEKFIENFYY